MNLLEQAQQLTLREMESQLTQLDFDWQKSNDMIENLIIEKAKQGEYKFTFQIYDNNFEEIGKLLEVKNMPRLYFKYLDLKLSLMGFKCNLPIERSFSQVSIVDISWN